MRRVLAVGSVFAVSLAAVTACSGPPDRVEPSGSPGIAASPVVAVSADETCAALTDVATVLLNSETAEREGRTVENEVAGARDLAARMMARVVVDHDSDLADVVASWSELITSPNRVAAREAFDPGSPEWIEAQAAVADACAEAGSELGTYSWTGG